MLDPRSWSFTFLGAAALVATACSSSSTTTGTTTGSGGSTGTTTGTSTGTTTAGTGGSTTAGTGGGSTCNGEGGTGTTGECPEGPGYDGMVTPLAVKTVEATVVDLQGNPMPNTSAQACGIDICITGQTDQNGHVLLSINKPLDRPAFKFGDALVYAKLAVKLDKDVTVYPKLVTAKLPECGPRLVPGKDITSGDVTLNVPAGGNIVVDDLIYDDADKQLFRAATIPVDQETAFLTDPTLKLELLYGVSPIETVMCPPAKVTVPNDAKWPAGTDVEFLIHGVEVGQEWAPYGGWQKVSDGKVSADGKTVSTADNGGLPVLTAFGVRKKQ